MLWIVIRNLLNQILSKLFTNFLGCKTIIIVNIFSRKSFGKVRYYGYKS